MNSRFLLWLVFFGSSWLLGQTVPPPVPRIIPEDPPAAPAPRPKIIPETSDPAEAPRPKIIPEVPRPVAPDLMPDPLPSVPETPLETSPPPKAKATPTAPKAPPAEPAEETIIKGKAVSDSPRIPAATPIKEAKPGIPISGKNDKNARTFFLTIPAPRGQIVDRNGLPLAQNRMGHFLGLQFQLGAELPKAAVLSYAHQIIPYIQKHTPDGWKIEDEAILEHYKNRRWLPLLANRPIPAEATPAAMKAVPAGIVIVPCYLRHYPNGHVAAHLLGTMGKVGGMSTQPIQNGDSLWPQTEGREGLEKKFNSVLMGTPGKVNIVFSATGEKVAEEIIERPKPGLTVVTSLDLEMQTIAERALKSRDIRGAFVIMEVTTGDVLAMASNPDFDPNLFSFGISAPDYAKLATNKEKPLLCRALNGTYPPASTFKVISAMAGLESGKIDGGTYYECTSSLLVGDRYFHNANRTSGEGSMNVVDAIKRSCNTWFYQAALATGPSPIASMASRLGLGEPSGICLPDSNGRVVTPEWWKKIHKGNLLSGDLMNICIGQGDTLVTPVQDCAMMCGIARGNSVPRVRLVQQLQNLDGTITEFFPPSNKTELDFQPENLRLVRAGMKAVVEENDGTGKGARNSYVKVCGKTGTAQWGNDLHMAWFAGFMPASNPQYAFAAMYEGDPGEDGISGGKKVAPVIGTSFEEIYKSKKQRGESLTGPAAAGKKGEETIKRARVAEEEDDNSEKPPKARLKNSENGAPPTEQKEQVEPAQPKEGGLRGLWNRIRGR